MKKENGVTTVSLDDTALYEKFKKGGEVTLD